MQMMTGTDYTLYLVFLRFAAWFCFAITIVNCVILIPIYISGQPKINDNWETNNQSYMNKLTILNITDSDIKYSFVYIFKITIVSGFA